MSNPCINRWGLNSFWQHYWYSDSKYALNLRQDKIFIELVQVYLTYGSNVPSTLFWNSYWYKTNPAPRSSVLRNYYRWSTVYNETLDSLNTYRLRLDGDEFFQTRVSILRFDSWILLNLYWFQPDKRRKKRLSRTRPEVHTEAVNSLRTSPSSFRKIRSTIAITALKSQANRDLYEF